MTDTSKAPPFAVEVEQRDAIAIVTVVGELDVATAPHLEQAFARLEPGYETLVVDLSNCAFFASSGISILLEETHRAKTAGFKLLVVKAPPQVQRMFDLAGLDEKLTFVEQPPA